MKTTIYLPSTRITFYNVATGQTETKKVKGELSNKDCKNFLFDGNKFITKEFETETFEVCTDELLKLLIKGK